MLGLVRAPFRHQAPCSNHQALLPLGTSSGRCGRRFSSFCPWPQHSNHQLQALFLVSSEARNSTTCPWSPFLSLAASWSRHSCPKQMLLHDSDVHCFVKSKAESRFSPGTSNPLIYPRTMTQHGLQYTWLLPAFKSTVPTLGRG